MLNDNKNPGGGGQIDSERMAEVERALSNGRGPINIRILPQRGSSDMLIGQRPKARVEDVLRQNS